MLENTTFSSLQETGALEVELFAQTVARISDKNRFLLLSVLESAGEDGISVTDLMAPMKMTQPNVSHHLEMLSLGGLASSIPAGKFRKWSLLRMVDDSMIAHLYALQNAFLADEIANDADQCSHIRSETFSSLRESGAFQPKMASDFLRTCANSDSCVKVLVELAGAGQAGVTVTDICSSVHKSQPAVSYFLGTMKDNKFAESEANGKFRKWKLLPQKTDISKHISAIINAFSPSPEAEDMQ